MSSSVHNFGYFGLIGYLVTSSMKSNISVSIKIMYSLTDNYKNMRMRECVMFKSIDVADADGTSERIRQAERSGEYALSEALKDIIVQEQDHEIDLKDALGLR